MTNAQRIKLMAEWWPNACRAQGWSIGDRAKRIEVLSVAVKRQITSASDLNNREDVDAVKAHLGMLANNVKATIETDNPAIGRARRLRETIRTQLKCLAVYVGGMQAAQGYLASIIRDKFKHGSRVEPLTIDDLDDAPIVYTRNGKLTEGASQLEQIVMTLSRNIQAKRKDAGDSLHDMKKKAGVECHCTLCRPRVRMIMQTPEPVMEEQPF